MRKRLMPDRARTARAPLAAAGAGGRQTGQARANSGQLEPIRAKWRLFRPVEADLARDEKLFVF